MVKVKKSLWREFLRLFPDGWSSEFESVDLLLEHLRGMTKSLASKHQYCYYLWITCLWITWNLKSSADVALQRTLDESRVNIGLSSQRKRWKEIAESLNFDIINPDQLISMAKGNPDQVARLIRKLALEYYETGSFRCANHIIAMAKTFFKVNKVDVDLNCFSMRGRGRTRKRQEYIPTLAEALKMAEVSGSLRNQLIILFLTYAGPRNSTLRAVVYNENFPEPLYQEYTIKKQLQKGERCLAIIVHEIMKKRVPTACKNNIPYYTFVPPKVTEYLILYLIELEEKYGPLRDDQPIFHTENRMLPLVERLMTPISERELQVIVKDAARRAGIKLWKYVYPHCLRKTFESFLRNQPDDVRLDIKERDFLMGHVPPGSQDAYFDKTKIEEMREKYARMIFEPVISVEKEERVIAEDELPSFLQQGWHFEATLPSHKIVVSRKLIKKASETDARSQSSFNLEKLGRAQQFNVQDVALNQPTQQSFSQEENEDRILKAKQPQNLANIVEESKSNKKERNVETLVSKQSSLDSSFQTQQKGKFEEGVTHKKIEQDRVNAPSKSKQVSMLDYMR